MRFPENATVVVVHGAWADGSSWQAVIGPLAESRLECDCRADSPHIA